MSVRPSVTSFFFGEKRRRRTTYAVYPALLTVGLIPAFYPTSDFTKGLDRSRPDFRVSSIRVQNRSRRFPVPSDSGQNPRPQFRFPDRYSSVQNSSFDNPQLDFRFPCHLFAQNTPTDNSPPPTAREGKAEEEEEMVEVAGEKEGTIERKRRGQLGQESTLG